MVEWSRAFGRRARSTSTRPTGPGSCATIPPSATGKATRLEVEPGLTLIHCGGHFAGSTVLHWAQGADGLGALLTRRHDHGGPGSPHRQLHVQLPQLDPARRARRGPDRRRRRAVRVRADLRRLVRKERAGNGKRRCATPRGATCTPSATVPKGEGHGSALAVDLRRARAARRRSERATAGAATRAEAHTRPPRRVNCGDREPMECVREWFARHDWKPFAFQEEVWRAYLRGESGLVHAATGTGKTYAAWLGPILEWLEQYPAASARRRRRSADRPVDHPAPRAGRRHRGRAPRPGRGSGAALERRVAHRRHLRAGARTPAASACPRRWSPRPRACRSC